MNEKSNKGIIIALLTVIVVLIGTIAFMFISNNNKISNNTNKEEKEETKDNEKEDLEEDKDEEDEVSPVISKLTETEMKYFMNELLPVFDNIYTSKEYNSSTLSDEEKIKFAMLNNGNGGIQSFNANNLLEFSKKYLGEVAGAFKFIDINCEIDNNVLYQYNSNTQYYNLLSGHGHGGIAIGSIINSYIDGEITTKDNEIQFATIKMRKSFDRVYEGPGTPGFIRFGTFNDSKNNRNSVADFTKELEDVYYSDLTQKLNERILKDMEENPEKYPVHTYIFKYDNGNYYLDSITIDK